MNGPKIEDVKEVWVVWQNTDLTEGRGWVIPIYVCSSETTAIRLGAGRDVQGCDCRVTKMDAVRIDASWYGPVVIHDPNEADKKTDELRERKRAAAEKAKALGLTEEEVKSLANDLAI